MAQEEEGQEVEDPKDIQYIEVSHRAILWMDRQKDTPPSLRYRYDSPDWRMQYFVHINGDSIKGRLSVSGHELPPPPSERPSLITRLINRGKKRQIQEVKTQPSKEIRHWVIQWGDFPRDEEFLVYYKTQGERPKGLEGRSPIIEGGFYSEDGTEPREYSEWPKAENFKEVNVFNEVKAMLDSLETSRVHQQGRYYK